MSSIHLETSVGMGDAPRLFLKIRDENGRVIADVNLTGDDALRLFSGGSVQCENHAPVKA
ncbi:MAG: hypothetical protein ACRDTZ_16030 [Pseudonocardiaceae bacterium]